MVKINPSVKKITLIIIIVLAVLLVLFAAWAFLWPGKSSGLQQSSITRREYSESIAQIEQNIDEDKNNSDLRLECHPFSYSHGEKTAKAVVLLHGVGACPASMYGLADKFYEEGYNVYVPRLPHHGFTDNKLHGQVKASELVDAMNEIAGVMSGLGEEIGAVGHSGGGTLATWLAQYGDGLFSRVLLLAPFYEPSTKYAAKWQLPLMRNLYGNHLLPDQIFEDTLSYRALANYMTIKQNYKADSKAENLKHVGVVQAELDEYIDADLAESIPQAMADASGASYKRVVLPASTGVGHAIVELTEDKVREQYETLYQTYFDAYENR